MTMNIFELLKWSTMNPFKDQTERVSSDRRRGTSMRYINGMLANMYSKNCLVNTDEFYGIVVFVDRRDLGTLSLPGTSLNYATGQPLEDASAHSVYKVYIPELECRPYPMAINDPILLTYQDVVSEGSIGYSTGNIVKVQYTDLGNMKIPKIVGLAGQVPADFLPAELAEGLETQFDNESPELIQSALHYTGPAPNADKLRDYLMENGISEKGNELSSGGDISPEIAAATISFLDTLYAELPTVTIRLTGGNDHFHHGLDYTSRHTRGNAVDFTVTPARIDVTDKVETILQRYAAGNGGYFRYLNEYDNPTRAATGKHFHMSWGAGTEAQANVDTAEYLASLGTIEAIQI